jgi:hypothetical protein
MRTYIASLKQRDAQDSIAKANLIIALAPAFMLDHHMPNHDRRNSSGEESP